MALHPQHGHPDGDVHVDVRPDLDADRHHHVHLRAIADVYRDVADVDADRQRNVD